VEAAGMHVPGFFDFDVVARGSPVDVVDGLHFDVM